jgi:1-acyl-sn-glycerol-3-phosphate acyltransferase
LIWSALLRLIGWSVDVNLPASPKYVLAVAPHTSNWDMPIGYIAKSVIGIQDTAWVGKASLFKPPFGGFLRWLGGIPVERGGGHSFVDQMVTLINHRERIVLAIAPEGTRGKTTYWKTGFYYIAVGAQIPIALAYLDYGRKRAGVGIHFMPTGDIERDFAVIRAFYQDIKGKYPHEQGEIRPRPPASANEAAASTP